MADNGQAMLPNTTAPQTVSDSVFADLKTPGQASRFAGAINQLTYVKSLGTREAISMLLSLGGKMPPGFTEGILDRAGMQANSPVRTPLGTVQP